MEKYSYQDLYEISGERINTLATRVLRMNLKGMLGNNSKVYFDKNQAFRILNYSNRLAVKIHPSKIEAVEMYSKEYRENDGFIIVESSINLNIINL